MKNKRKKRERKHRLRNASLKMSFMVYMLAFSALALLLMALTLSLIANLQNDLYWEYEQYNFDPDTGRRIYAPLSEQEALQDETFIQLSREGVILPEDASSSLEDGSLVLYDADGNVMYNSGGTLVYDVDGNIVGISHSSGSTMPEEAEALYTFYSLLAVFSVPFWIIVCLILASFLFYRNKLKEPIALMHMASAKIAESDLDFHLRYDNRNEMGQLVNSFEKMRAALHANHAEMWRAMEERKRLNAAFSHDLRTPLTVLHGYTDLLSERLPTGELPAEQVTATLSAMDKQLVRLDRYVENMQALHRLEDVQPSIMPVEGGALGDELRSSAGIICEASGKALDFTQQLPPRSLQIDPGLVLQVYENLLSNAARFAKTTVGVTLAAAADTLSITVTDDGPGFSPEDLQHAKDPFYSSSKTDGSHFGLGLNICDILCAKHGGRLILSVTPKGGGCVEALFAENPTGM